MVLLLLLAAASVASASSAYRVISACTVFPAAACVAAAVAASVDASAAAVAAVSQLLQGLKNTVERHSGCAAFRRVEYLAALGCEVRHRLWLQMEFVWGSKDAHTQQRSLFFTLADHFSWVA